MKGKRYVVSVEKPCSENWEEMLPTGNSRYCIHCAKSVIDCSTMSDSQISALITQQRKKGKSDFCARFSNDQLNRPLAPEHTSPSLSFALPVLVAGALALASCESPLPQKEEEISLIRSTDTDTIFTSSSTSFITIEGQVTNSAGDELSSATLRLAGTAYSTTTLPDGSFRFLNIPEGEYEIIASYPDYRTRSISYNSYDQEYANIMLYPLPPTRQQEKAPMGIIAMTMGTPVVNFEGSGIPVARGKKKIPKDSTRHKR